MRTVTRRQAIERRESKYFTGKPCKHGHIAERYTMMGNCVECARAAQRKDREALRAIFAAE